MYTECNSPPLEFHALDRRELEGRFNGGRLTSDGGLLLREVDVGLGCPGWRIDSPITAIPTVSSTVFRRWSRQRVYGLALGYEDLNDHDTLRADSLLATLFGKRV